MINIEFMRQVGVGRYIVRNIIRQFYKRVLKREHRLSLPTGRSYLMPLWDPSASEVFVTNASMDFGAERLFYAFVDRGVFIDIGAHTGYYSAYMAPKASRIIAVEPNDRCIPALESNLEGLPARIVHAFAGDKSGRVVFRSDGRGFSYADFTDTSLSVEAGVATQLVVTVDELVDAESVAAIKIDVDGPDLLVLDGSRATLVRDRPVVLIEAEPDAELKRRIDAVDYVAFGHCRYGASPKVSLERLLPEQAGPADEDDLPHPARTGGRLLQTRPADRSGNNVRPISTVVYS